MLEKRILATVAYYDVLQMPLTGYEVWWRLMQAYSDRGKKEPYYQIVRTLSSMAQKKILEEQYGHYHLPGRAYLYEKRIIRKKIADQKWKKVRRAIRLLAQIPFVRAIFGSGSLALNNMNNESDLDVLIITHSGRIWTTRFLVAATLSLLGMRRKFYQLVAPDKICTNHYITDRSLRIPFRSLYTAQLYISLIPLYAEENRYIENFYRENGWLTNYCAHAKMHCLEFRKNARFFSSFSNNRSFLKKAGEGFLYGYIGDILEVFLRTLQRRRIERNPSTYALGGRVVATDTQLAFHPDSPEKKIIAGYNIRAKYLGLPFEKDSGLIKTSCLAAVQRS